MSRAEKEERRIATEEWERTHIPESIEIDWAMCNCPQFEHPHPPHRDEWIKFSIECHATDRRK